jgi:hypothetical protein
MAAREDKMSYGRVNYEHKGIPIMGLPVREGVARGRVMGKIEAGSVFEVLDSAYYAASSRNPKAGIHLRICATINGKKRVGWVLARYSHPISNDAYFAMNWRK